MPTAGSPTSLQVHQNSLHKLVGTHVTFFDTTPIGRILNRFSKVSGCLPVRSL